MTDRKRVSLLLLLSASCVLTGCSMSVRNSRTLMGASAQEATEAQEDASDADTESTAAESYTVAFSCPDENNSYYAAMIAELRVQAEKRGSTLTVVSAGNDNMRQNSQIRRLLAEDPDGLYVIPVSASGVTDSLEDVRDRMIPVIGMETETSDISYMESYVEVNHYKAGELVAEELISRFPDGGNIAVLEQNSSSEVTERISGFMDAVEDHGFTVSKQTDGGGTRDGGRTAAQNLISSGSFTAIICGNDEMALGAMDALSEAELLDTVVYGFGGSPEYKEELVKGNSLAAGTCAKSPVSIADVASQLMFGYLDGSRLKTRYQIDPFMITAANAADFGTDGWQ